MSRGEVRPAPWALSNLENAKFPKERCAATIADLVLFVDGGTREHGGVGGERWLFTSKSGDVMRKRTFSRVKLGERFHRLANSISWVALERFNDGSLKMLTPQALDGVITAWPPFGNSETDSGQQVRLVAVQAHVAGSRYRNTYHLTEEQEQDRRLLTSTTILPNVVDMQHDEGFIESETALHELQRSRATRLNATLDSATLSIVRFLERTQHVKVWQLDAEYVVDDRDQLWLIWLGDARVATLNPSSPLRRQRSAQPRDEEQEEEEDLAIALQVSTASRKLGSATTASRRRSPSSQQEPQTTAPRRRRRRSSHEEDPAVSFDLGSTTTDASWPVDNNPAHRNTRTPQYPTEFSCAGSYCEVTIHDPKQLFAAADLASLGQGGLSEIREMVRGHASSTTTMAHTSLERRELRTIALRSVQTAREERKGLETAGALTGQARPWEDYPVSPRQQQQQRAVVEIIDQQQQEEEEEEEEEVLGLTVVEDRREQRRAAEAAGALAETATSRAHAQWVARQHFSDDPTRPVSSQNNPRRPQTNCRVCGRCHSVYTLLDKARELFRFKQEQAVKQQEQAVKNKKKQLQLQRQLEQQQQQRREQLGDPPRYHPGAPVPASLSSSSSKEPRRRLNQTTTTPAAVTNMPAATVTDTSVVVSSSGSTTVTWKGRLAEAELYGEPDPANDARQQGSLDAKHLGLEDYLRGKSDAEARRAESMAAATARSRAAQAKIVGGGEKNLFFGRVLVVERRQSPHLEQVVSTLEAAGYFVEVEFDPRSARTRFLESSARTPGMWRWDCVLVNETLDAEGMNAFTVVKDVRGMERQFTDGESNRVAEIAKERASRPHFEQASMLKAGEEPQRQQRLPVIVMARATASTDLRAYRESGMDGCVSKPVKTPALLSTVRAAVPRHGALLPNAAAAPSQKKKSSKKQQTVEFSVKFTDSATEQLRGSASALLDEVAAQLGLDPAYLAIDGESPLPLVHFKITANNGDTKALVKALQARSQLVDETRWGRHLIINKEEQGAASASGVKAHVAGALGTWGAHSSSAMAASSLSLAASSRTAEANGTLQLDADTSVPYSVLDFSGIEQQQQQQQQRTTFNLVVCQDVFETYERMKIVLSPIAARYPGLQVLLWNYPGQAQTEWRDDQLLSNVYFASCLNELLTHVGHAGTRQFDDEAPFYLMGVGYGASVCSWYATHYGAHRPQIRGCIFFNGWSFVDPHLAGALHDAMNVFSCAPPSRPDLPVYFWSRFLFSREYLTRVSTPLALNLYTAVHNPITLKGRMQLCTGALASHDVRPSLDRLNLPIVAIHSSRNLLVKPSHAQPWVQAANDADEPCATIHQALNARKTCLVWVKSGHELFQEQRKQCSLLLEQLLVGYHETNDVAFVPSSHNTGAGDDDAREPPAKSLGNFEDNFIENLLGKLKETTTTGDPNADRWQEYQDQNTSKKTTKGPVVGHQRRRRRRRVDEEKKPTTLLNPMNPAFERQDNVVYAPGLGSRIYPTPLEYPEVKEYMGWRLKRNKKRLERLEVSARVLQNAYRNHLAWSVVSRLRRERASLIVQRSYRGWRGRRDFVKRMRRVWAAHVLQRFWRGCQGRGFFLLLRAMHASSAQIQRAGRGYLARNLVLRLMRARDHAATTIQALWRGRKATMDAFELRIRVEAARAVERCYRGHLGRRRALNERHKFLFSKSQSQGIEFGRQMLLEHKLHATRLQSQVSLLTHEKLGAEESVEALLEEISEFEEGVAQLEKEMHQLSRIESEAVGVLDEEAKIELREQKMRLDREFGSMLAKIAERRRNLAGLEGKLAKLDHARQVKEEELRALERKLVLLLEEQQRELESIRTRQDAKGSLLTRAAQGDPNSLALVVSNNNNNNNSEQSSENSGGYSGGPSAKEKKQAAQLMQSTETLMKFGFMSMSMTYFSSLNMIRAMRTVSAQDTVMAALHEGSSNGGGDGQLALANAPYEEKLGGEGLFQAARKPGEAAGDAALKVSAWSVDDVARWLQTLSLGQYREAFVDAAVDGAFLYDLDDEDLKNTLGIEHRLHRKKILGMIGKLRAAEAERNAQLRIMLDAEANPQQSGHRTQLDDYSNVSPMSVANPQDALFSPQGEDESINAAPLNFEELHALVRHGKVKKVKDALEVLPNTRFDPVLVKIPFVEDFGTAYADSYEREHFNMNKQDEHANTMLIAAAQAGNLKIGKILVAKGANPNHQNKLGQTAGHYANAYQFFDFLSWLLDPDGGGGDDTLENVYGLGVYDGLALTLSAGSSEENNMITNG